MRMSDLVRNMRETWEQYIDIDYIHIYILYTYRLYTYSLYIHKEVTDLIKQL